MFLDTRRWSASARLEGKRLPLASEPAAMARLSWSRSCRVSATPLCGSISKSNKPASVSTINWPHVFTKTYPSGKYRSNL
ncbi:transcriptional regulator, GntR family domain protein [Burkholderia pseudomallei TSV5]|nr:hypothetical protein DM75_1522 [Burkholderia mallei]KGX54547.1 transcriptional regulator, GntR family domain protein [Burkholderia pseudomallei TSV5]KOT00503.1 hypothetical protein DM50_1517 [Burkholderia mallei]